MRQLTFTFGQWMVALCVGVSLLASNATADEEPFRPEAGKFPPLEKAHSYRGELATLAKSGAEALVVIAYAGGSGAPQSLRGRLAAASLSAA